MIKKFPRGGERNYLDTAYSGVKVVEIEDILEKKVFAKSKLLHKVNVGYTDKMYEDFYPVDFFLPEVVSEDLCNYVKTGSIGPSLDSYIDKLATALAEVIDENLQGKQQIIFSHADTHLHYGMKGKIAYLFLQICSHNRSAMLQAETSFKVA